MSIVSRTLVSIHGKRLGLNPDGHLLLDGRLKAASYKDPGALFRQFDHFDGPTLKAINWTTKKGSDGSCAFPVNQDSVAGGACRLVTGADAGGTMALNGSQLLGALQWDIGKAAGSQPLSLACKIQLHRITSIALFVGMTDQDSALEFPATLSSAVLTTNFTDGYGWLFDTGATAATWKAVGVANDVDAAVADSGKAPVADTDDLLLIEHDGTNCRFTLNGTTYAALTGCSRAATLLTPTIAVFSRSAVSTYAQADYISAEQST